MLINTTILSDHKGNALRLSSVKNFENSISFEDFSAKYVFQGEEKYCIDNKKYLLKKGDYVIGNKHNDANIVIESNIPVQGICIDIAKETIQEVIDSNCIKNSDLEKFLFTNAFFTNKYNSKSSLLGKIFDTLGNDYQNILQYSKTINNELFYLAAECIVKDQNQRHRDYLKLKSTKPETNKRLLGYLYDSKAFIDAHFHEKINIETVAQSAKLSEYHFIRLFKSVFLKTPYQYIVEKRLEHSKLLIQEKIGITDVAFLSGYADVSSFSKAFKNTFGYTPKDFKKIN